MAASRRGSRYNGDPAEWVKQYQARNTASKEAYERMFVEAEQAGVKLERPTHAGGTQLSNDKVVLVGEDGKAHPLFDIISNEGAPGSNWQWIEDGYWFNGKPASGPNGEAPESDGGPYARKQPPGSPSKGVAMARSKLSDFSMDGSYGAAAAAAQMQRRSSSMLGRHTNIYGGWAPGRPQTAVTVLGGRP